MNFFPNCFGPFWHVANVCHGELFCKSCATVSIKLHISYVTLGMKILKEKWLPVSGYEKLYIVSNHGRIYGIKSRKMLKGALMNKGYLLVNLWKNNKYTPLLVHRIVAKTFVKNPAKLPQVNHKDSNKLNNYANNLEWSTCQQNIIHSVQSGTFKASSKSRRNINQSLQRIPPGKYPRQPALL